MKVAINKKVLLYLVTMVMTYMIISLIIKGSFSNIEWDVILVMCSVSFVTLIIMGGIKEKNK
ncbi:hypothetical protein SAMN05660472_00419 [Natronincola ferrireducens]|uniref:Uncharacterized protein n=1 Tax=Natronincola ferrireducens TaxID=393762 RepID=A0A1G8Y5R6_9FIRM|nr:hypothetical protein SAMN05660472_00419 [Natronincola ferrireducens]